MVFRARQQAVDAPVRRHFLINRAFGLLWGGQTISVLGSHITSVGIPLIAILVLGAPPAQIGLLVVLGALPGLLCAPLVGVWVDRLPRRPLLLLSDLIRALLLLSLPVASLYGALSMPQLYLVTVLLSVCTLCFDAAYQSFLPQIIASDQLIEGNSKLGVSGSLAEVGGPPLAGGLIQLIGAPLAVFFDALSFLISALCVLLLRSHEIRPVVREGKRASLANELREGLRALFGHPLLRVMVIFDTVREFCGGTFFALYMVYIVRELRVAPLWYGVLVAVGGVGALLGSLITSRLVRRFGMKRVLLCGALLHGSLALLTPLASGPIVLVLVLMGMAQFFGDIGFALYAINETSLIQQEVPIHVQGRVNAVITFLVGGVAPFGALLAGIVSEYVGVRFTLFCGAGGILLVSGWLAWRLMKIR
jgi:MFS family permease